MADSERPRCKYQACRTIATALLVVELGPVLVEWYLCDLHQDRAKELAREFRAIAYRVVPF